MKKESMDKIEKLYTEAHDISRAELFNDAVEILLEEPRFFEFVSKKGVVSFNYCLEKSYDVDSVIHLEPRHHAHTETMVKLFSDKVHLLLDNFAINYASHVDKFFPFVDYRIVITKQNTD